MDELFIFGFAVIIAILLILCLIWAVRQIVCQVREEAKSITKSPKLETAMKTTKILKWVLLIIAAIAIYYFLYPKYHFIDKGFIFLRANRITGQIQILRDGKWENFKP